MNISAGILENLVKTYFKQAAECDPRILRSLDQAEHTIELDYRGRYFFELLQNARDAAASDGSLARVKVIVRTNELLVANTGRPFSKEGLESICSLGLSTKKNSNLFIGNKGLGFKSVLEITNQPRIVTQYGSVVFSREKAFEYFNGTDIHPEDLPLLFLPMYEHLNLERFEGFEEYTTLLILPFRSGITAERVLKDIQKIKEISYALMGNFEKLELKDETGSGNSKCLEVKNIEDSCQITATGAQPLKIKFYHHKVIPAGDQWNQFSSDEQKLFPSDSEIEIKIGLQLTPQGKFEPLKDTPLYLYYPLEEMSGFHFIIHSQFIATPNRKGLLENSRLNQFIFQEILNFINNQFVERICNEFPTQVLDIITHTPNLHNSLEKYGFYIAFSNLLSKRSVLWNEAAGRLLHTDEFLLLDKAQKNLFTDTMFGNQYIVYIPESSPTHSYLTKYMRVKRLTAEYIKTHIESYASRQLKLGQIFFFTSLYSYVAVHKIFLAGKKILLTEKNELLDNNSEVYYGSQRTDIYIPELLKGTIVFLHQSVRLQDVRIADNFIGVKEYTTAHLTRQALKIFMNQPGLRPALLRLFLSLYANTVPPKNLVETIQVPVRGIDQWVNPLSAPIYWPCSELYEMYPHGFFIDKEKLLDLNANELAWKTFLTTLNVWTAPSIYITIHEGKGDIILDIPSTITASFEKMLFENWGRYQSRVGIWLQYLPLMGVRSMRSLPDSSFITTLREQPWLSGHSVQSGMVRPSEVLVFPDTDRYSLQLKPLTKYFTIYFTPEANHDLLQLTGAISARKLSFESAVQMPRWAQKQYLGSPPQEKEFSSAWNRLYTLLYEFWRSTKAGDIGRNQILNGLKSIPLLAESMEGNRKKWMWRRGSEILYVDDQPLMDFLEDNVQDMLPPRFTKKDRNEIGIIISKVGIELSESTSKDLVPPNINRKSPFFECFHWSVAAVALLEDKMGNHIEKDQLTKLTNTTIVVSQNLSLSVSVNVGAGSRFDQKVPFYLNTAQAGRLELFLDEEKLHFRKSLASAVQELFGEVTNADHEMLLELQELIGTKTEKEVIKVLNELNIDPERIADLKGYLGHQQVSLRLLFWNELALAAGLLSVDEESLLPRLFEQMYGHYSAIEAGFWHGVDERMRLNDRWTWSTLQTALEVFNRAGLDIEILAGIIEGKVDLTTLNLGQLRLLVQSCRGRFVATLYQLLTPMNKNAQGKFLDFLDQYDHPGGLADLQSLRFDPQINFKQHLQNIATGIADPPPFLQLGHETMDDSDLYREKENLLRNSIREARLSIDHLARFLNNRAVKSLLLFEVETVFEQYRVFVNFQDAADIEQQEHQPEQPPPVNNNPIIFHTPSKPSRIRTGSNEDSGSGGKGKGNNQHSDPDKQEETGRMGEYFVYKKLLAQFPSLQWVSKNAEHYGETIEGDDTLHYDMRYMDKEGTIHYIEVKSTSGAWGRFNISRQQVTFGLSNKDCYHLYFVTHANNPELTKAKVLGPIFQTYDTVEDFENSPFLEVEVQDYLVRFA